MAIPQVIGLVSPPRSSFLVGTAKLTHMFTSGHLFTDFHVSSFVLTGLHRTHLLQENIFVEAEKKKGEKNTSEEEEKTF